MASFSAQYLPCNIHRVSKNIPPVTCYSLDIHNLITIIFGRSVTDKVGNQTMLVFPPHLCSASALPCEIGNPEDSALVHCVCNTVQFLQRSRLPFSWTMPPPQQPCGLNALITWFTESYSIVSQKDWRNQTAGWIQAMHWYSIWVKMQFLCFSILPGSAQVQKQKLFEVA